MRQTGAHGRFWWRAADGQRSPVPAPHDEPIDSCAPTSATQIAVQHAGRASVDAQINLAHRGHAGRFSTELRVPDDAPVGLQPLRPEAGKARRQPSHSLRLMVVAGCIGAATFAAGSSFGKSVRLAEPLPAQLDRLLVSAGLGVREVMLSGHRYTLDSEIYAALALDDAGSLLRYDVTAARERIESLAWVETASVVRVLPDKLAIRVEERRPIAIWTQNAKSALIDRTGRILSFLTVGNLPTLPRLTGTGAPAAAAALIAALQPHADILQRLEAAHRIGERRWTLELTNGLRVHLPADREGEALLRLAYNHATSRVLDHPGHAVDLRRDGVIALQSQPSTTLPATLPGSGPSAW